MVWQSESKAKSPRFAGWAIIIWCKVNEDGLCSTEHDETSDYFDDPSEDKLSTVLSDVKPGLINTDQLPDTQMVKESTLAFPRVGLWALTRAIGRARAVYARFLCLISVLQSLDAYETSQFAEVNKAAGLRYDMF